MSNFISPVDERPQFLISGTNLPMTYGKLFFYEIATSTPKSVYLDIPRTVVAGSVIQLDIDGRPVNQYYFGYGDYTVKAFKFIGIDPLSTDPLDWAEDREWNAAGLLSTVGNGAAIATCDTISDLRAIVPVTGDIRQVLGYYARGDMFTRTYQWNATDLNADNLGTIIKNPSIATGSWLLQTEGDVIDCRIFGIIPGLSTVYTSRIGSMITSIEASTNNPQSIFFPRGIYHVTDYTQTINTNVIFDKLSYFSNDSVGGAGYIFTISGSYEIYKNESLRAPASSGATYFKFNNNSSDQEVNVRWYGAVLDGVTDDGAAFEAMLTNITTSNYKCVVDGLMRLTTLTSTRVIYNPFIMRNTGRFYMDQTTYTLEFAQPSYIINENRVIGTKFYNPIFYCDGSGVFSNLNKFKFTNVDMYANWFSLNNGAGSTGSLHQPLGQIAVAKGTNFYFDMPLNNFSTSVDTRLTDTYNFVHTSGVLNATGTGVTVRLRNFEASDVFCIATDKFIIYGNPVKMTWYVNSTRTAIQNSLGYTYAVKASVGSGNLDLRGLEISTTETAVITSGSPVRYTVYNGSIDYEGANSAFEFNGVNFGDIYFRDITFVSALNCSFVAFYTASCRSIKFNNLMNIQSGSGSVFLTIGSGGSNISQLFEITNSYIQCGELLSNSGTCQSVRLNNNEIVLTTGFDIQGIRPTITGNYLTGTGALNMSCTWASTVSNNFFNGLSLYIHSVSSAIDAVVTGNTFTSSPGLLADIHLIADQANTEFKGCIITGNSFNGSQAALTECISTSGTFKLVAASHRLQISGNQSNRVGLLYVPQTESADWVVLEVPATHVNNEAKFYYKSSYNNLRFFSLSGCDQAPGYLHIDLISGTAITNEYGVQFTRGDTVNTLGGDGTTFNFTDTGGPGYAGGLSDCFAIWKIY